MKAWTLFSVILFPDIFRQRHTSAEHDNSNGLLQKKAKTIAETWYKPISCSGKRAQTAFTTIRNHQKLIIITADTEAEMSAEQIFDYTSLPGVIHLVRKINAKINFRPCHSAGTIVETTLINAYFL
ncbi:hypothetical protein SAMN05421594_2577 [Chryseobacterium oleae]|uniref:Uncharacterized protein n=1 Tax=Chryseobacterium oleae TaxID=491207 RepID=A0A1I4YQ83_CHROL|nr:hypothetical protein [Chryseobacterium oleae]SFN39943.1 hypothetical protein SAMN05421594_2577 [Chryseobacterium oleae]